MKTAVEWQEVLLSSHKVTNWVQLFTDIQEDARASAFREGVESVQKWIPVSERLPEKEMLCVVMAQHDGGCEVRRFVPMRDTGWWPMLYEKWFPLPEEQKEKP